MAAKAVVSSPRPDAVDSRVQTLSVVEVLGDSFRSDSPLPSVDADDGYGFPSGHVAASTAFLFGLMYLFQWTWVVASARGLDSGHGPVADVSRTPFPRRRPGRHGGRRHCRRHRVSRADAGASLQPEARASSGGAVAHGRRACRGARARVRRARRVRRRPLPGPRHRRRVRRHVRRASIRARQRHPGRRPADEPVSRGDRVRSVVVGHARAARRDRHGADAASACSLAGGAARCCSCCRCRSISPIAFWSGTRAALRHNQRHAVSRTVCRADARRIDPPGRPGAPYRSRRRRGREEHARAR